MTPLGFANPLASSHGTGCSGKRPILEADRGHYMRFGTSPINVTLQVKAKLSKHVEHPSQVQSHDRAQYIMRLHQVGEMHVTSGHLHFVS